MGFCVLLALTCLVLEAAAPFDRFLRAQQDFANAHNDFAQAIKHLSPDSPDYTQRLREEWLSRDIGQRFRRLERTIE